MVLKKKREDEERCLPEPYRSNKEEKKTSSTAPLAITTPMKESSETIFRSYRLLYATQSGRAKACARRVERTLRIHAPGLIPAAPTAALDDATADATDGATADINSSCCLTTVSSSTLLILFISTTGDGEPPDTMTNTWKQL